MIKLVKELVTEGDSQGVTDMFLPNSGSLKVEAYTSYTWNVELNDWQPLSQSPTFPILNIHGAQNFKLN